MISILDSAGVAAGTARRLRRREYFSKGPNYLWHFDGYDKLKPYGLCVSGCIDGYSRYIIWLRVYKTNNDPKVINGYYMDCIRERMDAPKKSEPAGVLKTDMLPQCKHYLLDLTAFCMGEVLPISG